MRYVLTLAILFVSCGKDSTSEKVDKAILVARSYLTYDKCQRAIDELEEYISSQSSNANYVQALTSAYACRSDYRESTLLVDDLENLGTAAGSFIRSLVNFSTSSSMDAVDNANYLRLQEALEYIQGAGFAGANPTAASRSGIFGSTKANNIHLQMLLMSLAQLGKYYHYYGNPDAATGAKGGGAGPNNCLLGYTDATAQAIINGNLVGATGSCSIPATGHPDLPIGTPATSIPRLCETLIVFNNALDLLSVLSIGTGTSQQDLDDILTPIDALFTTTDGLGFPQLRTVSDLRRQDDCETYGLANPDHIQQYFAAIIETVYQ